VGKAYSHFHSSYSHERLVEHFLLTPAELHFVLTFRGEPNRCGVALLLKVLPYLGYVPEKLGDIPQEVRAFITGQLGLLWDRSDDYPWYTSTRDNHVAQVRKFTGWRFLTAQDKIELEQWLRKGGPRTRANLPRCFWMLAVDGCSASGWNYPPKGNFSAW